MRVVVIGNALDTRSGTAQLASHAGLGHPSLAVASAAVVGVTVLGLPFGQFLMNLFYSPVQFSTAWTFLPIVVAAAVATVLGLGAVRQAFRHNAATWVRVVGGAATLIGLLLLVGTAIIWLYVVDGGLMEEFRNVY